METKGFINLFIQQNTYLNLVYAPKLIFDICFSIILELTAIYPKLSLPFRLPD